MHRSAGLSYRVATAMPVVVAVVILAGCGTGDCPRGYSNVGGLCKRIATDSSSEAQGETETSALPPSSSDASGTPAKSTSSEAKAHGGESAMSGAGGKASGGSGAADSKTAGTLGAGMGGSSGAFGASSGGAGSMAAASGTRCGNGVREGAEKCDGDCPSTCPAQKDCKKWTLVGAAGSCDAECTASEITAVAPGDGCCPMGATSSTDSDCSPSCGNGVKEAKETCDGADCSMSCDDGDPCTTDSLMGNAMQCNVTCDNRAVTVPKNGDGCCPRGANAGNDNDCETRCGDGAVTGSETCDGDCKTSCAAARGCVQERLVGSVSTCDAMCMSTVVTARVNNDGCCPPGSLKRDDNDCSAECASESDCSGQPAECIRNICRSGVCATEPLSVGTSCKGGAGKCDSNGTCNLKTTDDMASCVSNSDCTRSGQTCVNKHCVASCSSNGSSCQLSTGAAGYCLNMLCVPKCAKNTGGSVCSQYSLQCKAYDKCGCFMVCDVFGALLDPVTCDPPSTCP